jgi:hypothetical protein
MLAYLAAVALNRLSIEDIGETIKQEMVLVGLSNKFKDGRRPNLISLTFIAPFNNDFSFSLLESAQR